MDLNDIEHELRKRIAVCQKLGDDTHGSLFSRAKMKAKGVALSDFLEWVRRREVNRDRT